MSDICFIRKGQIAVICVDRAQRGLTRVANMVANDIRKRSGVRPSEMRVSGEPCIENGASANADVVVCAGILGQGGEVDRLDRDGLIDSALIHNNRESYITKVINAGRQTIIVIAGSDILGAEYGLLRLSELAGISPWHYWADVPIKQVDEIHFSLEELECVSKEPAVKLRGFFMNDEWPSLGNWAHSTFGGFNELFYEKVFDLLLRLRGNFLWPAMWTGVFSEDGKAFPTASAEMASELGIVMGTSHHEPLFRAGEEFSHLMTSSNDVGYGKDWSYHSNKRGIYEFWNDGVKRNKNFKSLITMGMRGERDSKILGENATLGDNIQLLKDAIIDQKEILERHGLKDAPTVLALYKEVEDYYYGDKETQGLKDTDLLDDMMLLLSDDNFGNLRTVPSSHNKDRKAGWGIYYHFDYHGGPISYEWVNSTPINKAWEQLTTAYSYGIKDLWVVNVGDLRPVELPLSYFMKLAFDYEEMCIPNRTYSFMEDWVRQQFGAYANSEIRAEIVTILDEYTRLNGDRRPEATAPDTFSLAEDNEAFREMDRAKLLINRVDRIIREIAPEIKDAFYGLVAFPAWASANLRLMMTRAGLYEYFASIGSSYANTLREEIFEGIARDKELVFRYNEEMSGGKWRHMMSSKHVHFVNWNEEGSSYPSPEILDIPEKGRLVVAIGETLESTQDGTLYMPSISNADGHSGRIYVMNTGRTPIDFDVTVTAPWIEIQRTQLDADTCMLEVWSVEEKIEEERVASIHITSASQQIQVRVRTEALSGASYPAGTFVETRGLISMLADAYARKTDSAEASWTRIDGYGKSGVSMKVLPHTYRCANPEGAPSLEYAFAMSHEGEYTIRAYIAPTNNPHKYEGLRFALQVDASDPEVIDTLPENFNAGDTDDMNWCRYVLDNGRYGEMKVKLCAGEHRLRFIHMDAGIVLQKIEIAQNPSRSFYGYLPTYQVN
ncbi:MAG: hypothetical protein GXY06_04835 [Clostridiaceae bacterium]|nr:hypothetical protein [Clostridiaceae bacterium]